MRVILFYHSLVSDWNHGNAHFLRGVATELITRGHDVVVYEPVDSWSRSNLIRDHGTDAQVAFHSAFPHLTSVRYDLPTLDLDHALAGADVVIVHEWNSPELVRRIGEHRARTGDYRLLFHDTHHRSVTEPEAMGAFDLSAYDAVLAFGQVIADIYRSRGWAQNVFVWHEAADTRVFAPQPDVQPEVDVIWIGNWGDDERTAELFEFLIEPVRALGLRARVHGVRYPDHALAALDEAGIEFAGFLPNYRAPRAYAAARLTVHVPRRPYVEALPGVPTIRVFEALACGIPLICAPWQDSERLFQPGRDFLVARSGDEMAAHMQHLLHNPPDASALAEHGRNTVLTRHGCGHRVDELLAILEQLNTPAERVLFA